MKSRAAELINWQTKAERLMAEHSFEAAHGYCMKILAVNAHYGEAYFLLAQIAAEYGNSGVAERRISLQQCVVGSDDDGLYSRLSVSKRNVIVGDCEV